MLFRGKKIVKNFLRFFIFVFMLFEVTSCASNSGSSASNKSSKIDKNALVGKWFWDFGYDQEQFCNDQLDLKKDGTFEIVHIQPEWCEWDNGDWSVIDDEKYGPTIVLHITQGKQKFEDAWDNLDVKIYYSIDIFTDDVLQMSRFKRDVSAMNWGIQYFDPAVTNNFKRIKPGDVNALEGKWQFNRRSKIPVSEQNETWRINGDGTIDCNVSLKDKNINLLGTYDVDKKNILHFSFNRKNGLTQTEAEEYWYEFNTIGENLIKVSLVKSKEDGKEIIYSKKEEEYFYRSLDLATYTYHCADVTFTDKYPYNQEYETVGLNKMYLFNGIPDTFLKNELLGWYDNPELKGEPIKFVHANDSFAKREFWPKWTIKCSRSEWNNSDGTLGHNHGFELPASIAFENFKAPSAGDTVKVLMYAKTTKDIDGWGGPTFVDFTNNWTEVAEDGNWKPFKTHNKVLMEVFELKISDRLKTSDINQIGLRFAYDKDALDESCIFEEYKFEIIDENNASNLLEHTLNYGGFEYKYFSYKGYPFYFPDSPKEFREIHWTLYNNTEIAGWYDNPEFKGNPIDMVLADQNTKARTFYGKPNFKFYPSEKQDNGNFYSNLQVLVKSVIPNAKINPKAGDVVKVALSATLSKDFSGNMGLDLANNRTGFDFLGNDWHTVQSENGKLETCFEIKLEKDADFKNIDEPQFLLAYNPYAEGEVLYLSDVKFEFVDRDPYIKPYASSKHMKVEPCNEGFKFTITKAPEDTNQWQWNMNVVCNTYHELSASPVTDEIDKNGTVSFIWPFVEKGKDYAFTFKGNDANGKWLSETVKVTAQNGKGELNYKALEPIQISLESNSKEANVCAKNLTTERIMDLVKAYKDDLLWVSFGCPIISGKNDWSDSEWLFKPSLDIFPEINGNTFYIDLMKNGKANLFGDYNLGWGDAQKINNALSQRSTFWTKLDVNFKIKQNSECIEFVISTLPTENTPYVPVKF